MSAQAGHLRVVHDPETGETLQSIKADNERQAAIIKGLERDIRGWMVRYRQLEQDRAAEAREHVLWPLAKRLFVGWQRMCGHPKTKWTEERFWLIEPYLSHPRWGKTLEDRVGMACRAIKGAQHDHHKVTRKNGTVWRWNEWDRIFGSPAAYDEFRAKAPLGWVPPMSDSLRLMIAEVERVQSRRLA